MLQINNLVGFGARRSAGGGGAAVPTFVGSTSAGVQSSPYTATGVSIGTAASNRYIVVVVMASNDALGSGSVTVAGQSTTRVVAATGGGRPSAIFVTDAPVTTGTTATVVITVGATADIEFAVYTLIGAASPTAPTTVTDTADPLSQSATIPANGCAIACANLAAGTTTSWTGATKQADGTGTNFRGSTAMSTTAGAATIAAGGGTGNTMAIAIWSP